MIYWRICRVFWGILLDLQFGMSFFPNEMSCGITHSATILRIWRTVAERVVPRFIWRWWNELRNDVFHNYSLNPEDSCGIRRSTIYFKRTYLAGCCVTAASLRRHTFTPSLLPTHTTKKNSNHTLHHLRASPSIDPSSLTSKILLFYIFLVKG